MAYPAQRRHDWLVAKCEVVPDRRWFVWLDDTAEVRLCGRTFKPEFFLAGSFEHGLAHLDPTT